MVPSWALHCCGRRDAPPPQGAAAPAKAVWTGRGDATYRGPAPDPLGAVGPGDISGLWSQAPQPPGEIPLSISASSGAAAADALPCPDADLCGNLGGFSCPGYS